MGIEYLTLENKKFKVVTEPSKVEEARVNAVVDIITDLGEHLRQITKSPVEVYGVVPFSFGSPGGLVLLKVGDHYIYVPVRGESEQFAEQNFLKLPPLYASEIELHYIFGDAMGG